MVPGKLGVGQRPLGGGLESSSGKEGNREGRREGMGCAFFLGVRRNEVSLVQRGRGGVAWTDLIAAMRWTWVRMQEGTRE